MFAHKFVMIKELLNAYHKYSSSFKIIKAKNVLIISAQIIYAVFSHLSLCSTWRYFVIFLKKDCQVNFYIFIFNVFIASVYRNKMFNHLYLFNLNCNKMYLLNVNWVFQNMYYFYVQELSLYKNNVLCNSTNAWIECHNAILLCFKFLIFAEYIYNLFLNKI